MWQQSIFSSFSYLILLAVLGNIPIEQFIKYCTKASKMANTDVLPSDIRRAIKEKMTELGKSGTRHIHDHDS